MLPHGKRKQRVGKFAGLATAILLFIELLLLLLTLLWHKILVSSLLD